jgi:hypothetical protein
MTFNAYIFIDSQFVKETGIKIKEDVILCIKANGFGGEAFQIENGKTRKIIICLN